jgi:predicted outer membrane repeat protein
VPDEAVAETAADEATTTAATSEEALAVESTLGEATAAEISESDDVPKLGLMNASTDNAGTVSVQSTISDDGAIKTLGVYDDEIPEIFEEICDPSLTTVSGSMMTVQSTTLLSDINTWLSGLATGTTNLLTFAEDYTLIGRITISGDYNITIQGATGSEVVSRGTGVTGDLFYTSGVTATFSNIIIDGQKSLVGQVSGALINQTSQVVNINKCAELKNNDNSRGGGVTVNGGIINMNGGYIHHNDTSSSGGGIYSSNSVTVNINGGTIAYNTAMTIYGVGASGCGGNSVNCGGGGGVQAAGIVNMSGGTIAYNSVAPDYDSGANSGGGGGVFGEILNLTGGEIRNNEAEGKGAGVVTTTAFTMSDGKITGNQATDPNVYASGGGGVCSQGTVSITGGEISNNTANAYGGGILIDTNATADIAGGEISNNTANTSGGGIYSNGTLNIVGGTIGGDGASDANTATYGGGVYSSGSLTIDDGLISNNTAQRGGGVYINTDKTADITGGEISNNTATGTNSGGGGIYNLGIVNVSNAGLLDNTGYYGGAIYSGNSSVLYINNGTLIHNNTANTSGGGIYSNGTLDITGGTIGGDDASDANTATYGGGVYSSGSLTIDDGLISHNTATSGGSIRVSGMMIMDNGIISNSTADFGGGINIVSGATATINGGNIHSNTANASGGGIYSNGTLDITGGTIGGDDASDANTATYGGGVYSNGSLTIDDGLISHNTAQQSGGVYININTTADITGGEISNNTANTYGGGILIDTNATADIAGGVISNNTANTSGGGVYLNGTVNITGGEISNNTSKSGGGFQVSGTLNISGGLIDSNVGLSVAFGSGIGGISTSASAIVNITAGTISNNVSNSNGGGMDVWGTLNMSGGTFTGNTAANGGAGIYFYTSGTINLSGNPKIGTSDSDNGILFDEGKELTVVGDLGSDSRINIENVTGVMSGKSTTVANKVDDNLDAQDALSSEAAMFYYAPGTTFTPIMAVSADGTAYVLDNTYLKIELDSDVDFSVTPTAAGHFTSSSQEVSVITNNLTGYLMSISTNQPSDNPNAKDLRNLSFSQQYITSTDNTCAWDTETKNLTNTTNTINNNTWGFTLNPTDLASQRLCQIPDLNNPLIVKQVATPNESGDNTDVFFGAKVNLSKLSGTYQTTIIYNAVPVL